MAHICILPSPAAPPKGRERVIIQRKASRQALAVAAQAAGAPSADWEQEEESGRPLPNAGWHWSVTHDAHFVGAIVARVPVGIDTEQLTLRRRSLVERVLDKDEQDLLAGNDEALAFTRAWCAKESVLKATGIGIGGLSRCKIQDKDGSELALCLDGKDWRVVQRRKGKSLFAVTMDAPTVLYHWNDGDLAFDPWSEQSTL